MCPRVCWDQPPDPGGSPEAAAIASAVPGVAGAQIAGAGLGGCVMVLAHNDAVEINRRVANASAGGWEG